MKDKKKVIVQNIDEGSETEGIAETDIEAEAKDIIEAEAGDVFEAEDKAEETTQSADSVMDDDIQYTFVVPRGEIYRDPDDFEEDIEAKEFESDDIEAESLFEEAGAGDAEAGTEDLEAGEDETEAGEFHGEDEAFDTEAYSVEVDDDFLEAGGEGIPEPVIIEPEPAKTIIANHRHFTDTVNNALADAAEADAADFDEGNFFDSDDDFFDAYMAADPKGRTAYVEPPVYESTGLSEEDADDIVYTFVVPKGEIYQEPDPEEEARQRQAERLRRALLAEETKVMERKPGGAAGEEGSGEKTHYGLPSDHPGMGELAQKQEARRLYKQQKKNRFRTRFYVLMTVLILGVFWLIISNSNVFTIDSIVVQGNSHYTAEEIINMSHATPGRNIIYKANIQETKEYLENNPYIRQAEVKRRLPSTLVIKVTERQERMAFKYDDDFLVMDEDGILLRKTRNTPMTTVVQGVVVSKIKLGEKIGAENSDLLDKSLSLIKMMIKSDLYFVKVDMSKEKSLNAYVYDTLVVKADYDTLMANMENGKLHLVLEKLFEDGIERGTISFLEDGSASFMPGF